MNLTLKQGDMVVRIGHFTIVCLVTWTMTVSEAVGDLALVQTSLVAIQRPGH